MLKLFICVLLCLVTSNVKASQESESISRNELPCLSFGGICVRTDDCPEDKRSQIKGLCPLRQNSGVECCHSIPTSETRCRKRGGRCVAKNQRCPENLTFSKATDCADDQKCCILV